jgi:tRNA(Ile2) C34 agmatinyltransferase TiaS
MRLHSIYQITCRCGRCHEREEAGEFRCSSCGRLLVIDTRPGETTYHHLSDK